MGKQIVDIWEKENKFVSNIHVITNYGQFQFLKAIVLDIFF